MHTYIHTYTHTHIHTYIHTYMSVLTLVVINFLPEIIFLNFHSERVKMQECVNKMHISLCVWMMPHHTSTEYGKTEPMCWAKFLYAVLYFNFLNLFNCVE